MSEWMPTGFFNNVGAQLSGLNEKLDQLNSNLQATSRSTERLAFALNVLTGSGAVVAAISVIVAIVDLVHRWHASG